MIQPAKDHEIELMHDCAEFYDRPYDFVLWCWPWGEPDTRLEDERLESWQTTVLKLLQEGLTTGKITHNNQEYDAETGIYISVRSGHGIGKSALMGMLTHWFQSCHDYPRSITTANTKDQLTHKTWSELAKWHDLALNRHWFIKTRTLYFKADCPDRWFASAIPWSEHKAQAFAGTHADQGGVMLQFDEASEIPDIIWETAEGAMTDKKAGRHRIFIAFGNPTKNTGRFHDCFHKFRHRWINIEIDARTVTRTDKNFIAKQIEDWGIDSDYVRVRVLGKEPAAAVDQFIPTTLVDVSSKTVLHPHAYYDMPKVISVDVARQGECASVICKRQGFKVYTLIKHRPPVFGDLKWLMTLADHVSYEINEFEPDAVFVDADGMGAGVVDRLRQLGHAIFEVHSGVKAMDERKYSNKRAEMWGRLRDWLSEGGVIPNDPDLKTDLVGPTYGFDNRHRIKLERKEDMLNRGLASPDCGDALAMSFYSAVRKDLHHSAVYKKHDTHAKMDYDIFADL